MSGKSNNVALTSALLAGALATCLAVYPLSADARGGGRGGGGGGGRAAGGARGGGAYGGRSAPTSINRSGGNNVRGGNRVNGGNTINNVHGGNNINNVNIDVDNGWRGGVYHPIAVGAAIGATAAVTAAVVGSRYYALPPACAPYYSTIYYYCGGVYYQPVYQGTTITYVVVNQPPH